MHALAALHAGRPVSREPAADRQPAGGRARARAAPRLGSPASSPPCTPRAQAGLGGAASLKTLPQLAAAMRDSSDWSDCEEWLGGAAVDQSSEAQVGGRGGEEPPPAGGLRPAWGGA